MYALDRCLSILLERSKCRANSANKLDTSVATHPLGAYRLAVSIRARTMLVECDVRSIMGRDARESRDNRM